MSTRTATTVHTLEIPTPFAVGAVNAYLIDDEPLTLIDPGPASTFALQALEDGLAAHGYSIQNLELILVTHQHLDHTGLAAYLAARTSATIACLDRLAPYLESFDTMVSAEDDDAAELMARHGVPQDIVDAVRSMSTVSRRWGASVTIGRELAPGSFVELRDRRLRVLHAPGHSPSCTLFLDEQHRMLFTGDHLLPTTSSNAFVASRLPDTPKQARYPALRTYRDSLAATRALDVDVVLPGHGAPILDHRTVIDERLAQHEERADRILDLVRKQQPTAHELARELWGKRAITQAYLTISEVLGHLDLLIERELVVEHDQEHPIRFTAA